MTTTTQDLIFEKKGEVGILTMNRPAKLNSWSTAMQAGMVEALKDCQADPKIRAIIITGAGDRAFSSGADVFAMAEHADRRMAEAATAAATGIRDVPTPGPASPYFKDILSWTDKPLVAAINGLASGGGLGLVFGSDIRVASEKARFISVYMRRGMVVSSEVWYWSRYIGLGRARDLILLGGELDAQRAHELGVVTKVVSHEKLLEEAMAFAEQLADGPAVAMRFTKQAIYKGLTWDFQTTMDFAGTMRGVAAPSGENREGARSFVEKRKPNYR